MGWYMEGENMDYLETYCPYCGEQKLYEDSDGDGIDTPVEEWIVCDSCGNQVIQHIPQKNSLHHLY